jgi:DnaJ-class molecular chaperone
LAQKRDYYEVLGVGRSASTDEIRKAYKRLAKKYHPDYNPGDKKAEANFKEVSEAYAVLANDESRKKYDTFGHQGPGAGPGFDFSGFDFRNMRGNYSSGGETFSGSFGDILSELFGGRGGRARGGGGRGQPFGGFGGFGGFEDPAALGGRDLQYRMAIDFMLAAKGGVTKLQVPREGREDTVSVRIPAGVDNGQTIRIKGKGEVGPRGPAGDLLIEVTIEPHKFFKREGLDLFCTLPITIAEAVLGAKVQAPTLDGGVTITIPPGTQGGQTLRVRGRGIRKKAGAEGDLYVAVTIVVPKRIDEKSKSLIQEFDRENPLQPRAGLVE